MKKIIYFLLIFIPMYINSQPFYSVEYELKIANDDENNDLKNKYINLANEGASKITFILEFNTSNSNFYLLDNLYVKERNSKLAIAMSDYDNLIYNDLKEQKVLYNNREEKIFKNEEFLIKDTMFSKWELVNESKLIQSYLCFKAIGKKEYYEGEKKFIKDIIAWYCPQFPYQFGPDSYGNLPGLILESSVGDVLFGAKKISYTKEYISKQPTKGTKISRENYMKEIIFRREKFTRERE